MNRLNKFFCVGLFLFGMAAGAAGLPSEWQHEQSFSVPASGLVKISLPVGTLDAARSRLEDLRLYDDAGNEVPYVVERPAPSPRVVQPAKSFQVSLNANSTVMTVETGLSQPIDAVMLQTPARDFIKAARIDVSNDGQNWRRLVQGQPIFRQSIENLKISFAPQSANWLRVTVDDQRSGPVPFTGAVVFAAAGEPAPSESFPATISERDENAGVTRLALDLGAANLDVASIRIETREPLFMRSVYLAVPQISGDAIHEQVLGDGAVYRVAVEGEPASESLAIPFVHIVDSRELILLIHNGDSPPLPVSGVRIERRPVYLTFLARQPGVFHLLTGNPRCAAPQYDLAGLNMDLRSVPVSNIKIPPPSDNQDFHAPEVLAGLEIAGAPLDTSPWRFRKPVKISRAGAQQVELDPDVLSHSQSGFADLRVMHGSNQVPYIIQHTSISRSLALAAVATNDIKEPALSRWIIKLPQAGLPLMQLSCMSPTPLFQRSMSLYEMLTDDQGQQYRRTLGSASWTRTPDRKLERFTLAFEDAPQTDTLYLETENGDNPAIELEGFTAFYPVTRILFKASAGDDLYLYYGNPDATTPQYDLSLVANQLLGADKMPASLAAEQPLKKGAPHEVVIPNNGGILFWGILAVVVVVLLVVISRLLPKPQS